MQELLANIMVASIRKVVKIRRQDCNLNKSKSRDDPYAAMLFNFGDYEPFLLQDVSYILSRPSDYAGLLGIHLLLFLQRPRIPVSRRAHEKRETNSTTIGPQLWPRIYHCGASMGKSDQRSDSQGRRE